MVVETTLAVRLSRPIARGLRLILSALVFPATRRRAARTVASSRRVPVCYTLDGQRWQATRTFQLFEPCPAPAQASRHIQIQGAAATDLSFDSYVPATGVGTLTAAHVRPTLLLCAIP
ncbi:hypothetical protein K466DRAFT_404534 [Polyporus arcularius HHB13444]|uniref:Uncharacterized protein n=1 Tax=Polyporus arcularius HHB13444 TaxID=1314778 RepID=A0A5C3PLG5_9APHY|nr:hypothetical protein K466DRAFT_404534 [Polyporus arcularius HHB13444]